MRLSWSPEATRDLKAIRDYISEDNPAAAGRILANILRTVHETLPRVPQLGRPDRVPGTRELVIPRLPYIVPYRGSRRRDRDPVRLSRCAALAGDVLITA